MKTKTENFEYLKMFCGATLSFYIITAIFFVLTLTFSYIGTYPAWEFFEFFLSVTEFLITICIFLPILWFLITFIWCLVICKQEHSPRVFARPIIIINLLISLFLPIILIQTGF